MQTDIRRQYFRWIPQFIKHHKYKYQVIQPGRSDRYCHGHYQTHWYCTAFIISLQNLASPVSMFLSPTCPSSYLSGKLCCSVILSRWSASLLRCFWKRQVVRTDGAPVVSCSIIPSLSYPRPSIPTASAPQPKCYSVPLEKRQYCVEVRVVSKTKRLSTHTKKNLVHTWSGFGHTQMFPLLRSSGDVTTEIEQNSGPVSQLVSRVLSVVGDRGPWVSRQTRARIPVLAVAHHVLDGRLAFLTIVKWLRSESAFPACFHT